MYKPADLLFNMRTDNVVVKSSSIHGKGVFAARDFKAGEIILRWDVTDILSEEEVKKMSSEEKRYVSCIDGKHIRMQEPEKFVNHSCNANTTAKQFCDIANRDIKTGEEITTNYRKELPSNTYIKCNCGGKNCIGIIKN